MLPDVQIVWRDVWFGAGSTAILFVIGKFVIGLYLGNSGLGAAYGAAGSVIVFLIWVYYSSYAIETGSRFVPQEHAQWADTCNSSTTVSR